MEGLEGHGVCIYYIYVSVSYAASHVATELFPSVKVFDLWKKQACATIQISID